MLQAELAGRVFVIDCMVDRVCTGRSISEEGVDVSAEPWKGSIVILEPNLTGRLPFCSSVATAPRSAEGGLPRLLTFSPPLTPSLTQTPSPTLTVTPPPTLCPNLNPAPNP